MTTQPLVSVIVPTKNSASFIGACLESIQRQTYRNIELIVVDNNSSDNTKQIATQYTKHVFNHGPERCAQRNFGASKSAGAYVFFIDSDMELDPDVIANCLQVVKQDSRIKGVIIPEKSFGQGFWAQCKALEKSFYVGVDWIEAARFYDKEIFNQVGGWDESMISGEDWDLSQRVRQTSSLGRCSAYIRHNEGQPSLKSLISKKFYYAEAFSKYLEKNKKHSQTAHQIGPIRRLALFFGRPRVIVRTPFTWLGLIIMKVSEFTAGALGYIKQRLSGMGGI